MLAILALSLAAGSVLSAPPVAGDARRAYEARIAETFYG